MLSCYCCGGLYAPAEEKLQFLCHCHTRYYRKSLFRIDAEKKEMSRLHKLPFEYNIRDGL